MKSAAIIFLLGLVILSGGLAFYFYAQSSEARHQYSELKQNPQKITEEEVRQLVAKVGRLMILPEGETPTVATVADPEKLKDQPFFANAKVGDKVLIYTNSKRAILYDPSADKIVEVAPLNIGNDAQK